MGSEMCIRDSDSAVRENKEVEKMLENYSIKGGIKVKSSKV